MPVALGGRPAGPLARIASRRPLPGGGRVRAAATAQGTPCPRGKRLQARAAATAHLATHGGTHSAARAIPAGPAPVPRCGGHMARARQTLPAGRAGPHVRTWRRTPAAPRGDDGAGREPGSRPPLTRT